MSDSDGRRAASHARPELCHVTVAMTMGGVSEVIRSELGRLPGHGLRGEAITAPAAGPAMHASAYLHRALYGDPEVDPPGPELRAVLDDYVSTYRDRVRAQVKNAAAVVLHDPLCLTLAPEVRSMGVPVLWRCHIGDERPGPATTQVQELLTPYIEHVDVVAFLRTDYIWPNLRSDSRVRILPPGLDETSTKNRVPTSEEISGVSHLLATGRLPGASEAEADRTVLVDEGTGWLADPEAIVILQVSRWDPLKGHDGVLHGFVRVAAQVPQAHLVLAGPHIDERRNYPINQQVWQDLFRIREGLTPSVRARVHLWKFASVDRQTEDHVVNLLQRRADLVVQNSRREAFGLTVTEAMWKHRVVLGSAVGGIREQVDHEVTGLLSEDMEGGEPWAQEAVRALTDTSGRIAWSTAAHARVSERYLIRHQLVKQLHALGLVASPTLIDAGQ